LPDPLASTTLSYAAYAEIPADGQRWEFLDGEVFVTPAPSPAHQFAVPRGPYEVTATPGGNGTLAIADLPGPTLTLERLWLDVTSLGL
jgi:hypothetical protein